VTSIAKPGVVKQISKIKARKLNFREVMLIDRIDGIIDFVIYFHLSPFSKAAVKGIIRKTTVK